MAEDLQLVKDLFTGEITGERIGRVPTHAELCLSAEVDPDMYETTRINSWTTSFKDRESGEIRQVANWQRRAAPKKGVAELAMLEQVKAELLSAAPKYSAPVIRDPRRSVSGNLLMGEVALFDIHMAMLAWEPETGDNYDLGIARQRADQAYERHYRALEHHARDLDHILLPIGQDLFHTDGIIPQTTAGTPQDVDTRWAKSFLVARQMITDAVGMFLDLAPVKIVVVPGNHAEQKAWYLGEVLRAYYEGAKDVKVDNRPRPRKYHGFGKNLIGFTHGDKEKHKQLAGIMAAEAPKHMLYDSHDGWREWHVGHLHRNRMYLDEETGVRVRWLPSLAGTDAWHNSKGYINNQIGSRSLLWDREHGLVETHNFNVRREIV